MNNLISLRPRAILRMYWSEVTVIEEHAEFLEAIYVSEFREAA